MNSQSVDFLILGSGFGGSLLSMILARSGRTVALVDRATHPRFTIGESSTPLADTTLQQLAETYNLPQLLPLTRYGSWKSTHPELTCGLKRGFSYFGHTPDHDLTSENISGKQLLVAASSSDEKSDTHWLRSDVDRFFFEQARSVGVQTFEGSRHQLSRCSDTWQLKGESQGKSYNIRSPFIVDATGPAAEVLKYLHVPDQTDRLGTHSQALYAHFDNVLPVRELLTAEGISVAPHPFDCDAAAVHQVLDNGWMWQLRFDDQSVSAGFVMNTRHASGSSAGQPGDATELWHQQLQRFPFLGRQFASARIVRPAGGIQLTTRLQRLTTQAAGPDWAALPNTAGFVDPLHSTGIAHTMFGIRRLAHILLAVADLDTRTAQLPHYSTTLINEIRLVDELVEGCYAALPDFRLWSDWCMLYFAAVTSMEQTHSAGQDTSFLLAANHEFRTVLKTARQHLQQAIDSGSTDAAADFEIWLRRNIAPWNSVGLLDDSCRGMYSNTAAP